MGCGFSLKKWQTRWQKSFQDFPEESNKENEKDNKKMYEHLKKIADSSFPGNVKKMRKEGTRLIYSGSFGVIGKEVITYLQPKEQSGGDTDQEKSGKKESGEKVNYPLLSIRLATDGSDAICEGVLQYEYLFPKLLSKMKELLESVKPDDSPQKSELCKTLLPYVCIVHNIAMYVEDLEVREGDKDAYDSTAYVQKQTDPFTHEKDQRQTVIDILSECINCDDKTIRLKSNVALACLVLKSQGKDCVEWQGGLTSRKVAKTLLKHLLLALDDKKHQSHGCSALAIERGLRHLLRIYDKDVLDFLYENRVLGALLRGFKEAKTDKEEEACFFSLWLLHFKKEWLQEMQKDKLLEDLVTHALRRTSVKKTKRAEDLQKSLNRLRDQKKSTPQTSPSGGHVMLSYCHKNKTLVEKIADRLKSHGVDLWVDSERIHQGDNMYSAMAKAVKEASIVIVCMSQGYFESQNCQKEARYASDSSKTIIPLVVEEGYRAESWLAFIIAGLIYHDLSKENDFDTEFEKVLEKIKEVLGKTGHSKDASAKANPDSTAPPASKKQDQLSQHEQTASRSSTVPPTSKEQPLQHEKQTTNRGSTTPSTSKQKDQILQRAKQTYTSGNGTRRSVKLSTRDANTTQSQQYLPQDRSVERGEDSIELGRNELLYLVKLPHVVPEVYHKRMGKGLMMKTAHEVSRLTELLNGYQLSSGSMTVVHCTF